MGLALIFVGGGAGAPDPARGTKYNGYGYFPAGQNDVVIALYDAEATGSSAITLSDSSCVEIGSTGLYVWDGSKIGTLPTPYKEYGYVMTDGVTSSGGGIEYDEFLIQYIIHENMEI